MGGELPCVALLFTRKEKSRRKRVCLSFNFSPLCSPLAKKEKKVFLVSFCTPKKRNQTRPPQTRHRKPSCSIFQLPLHFSCRFMLKTKTQEGVGFIVILKGGAWSLYFCFSFVLYAPLRERLHFPAAASLGEIKYANLS